MSQDQSLRDQLVKMLEGSEAHASFERTVKQFPVELAGVRPQGLPHSAWELLEHLRITQNDILRFSTSAEYQELSWPEEYWPASAKPGDADQWEATVALFGKDLKSFTALIQDPGRHLHAAFSWGQGQTLLREAILLIDHNSYHLGQLVLVRRALSAW